MFKVFPTMVRIMMSVPSALPLLSLALIWGASGAKWSVKYNQQEICAVNRSTVFMNGSFTHPEGLTVTQTCWAVNFKAGEPDDLSKDPNYSGRVKYLTDAQKHFALTLRNVMKKDEHMYHFRIITKGEKQKWMGKPGVRLKITELHVESPGEVTEGESAVLTCGTTCSLTDPTFIWFKDGRPLPTNITQKNQLHLQTVSSEDTGSYSCAVRGSEHLHSTTHSSTAQTLRVRHPPKNVSVSINSSSQIVTLICSSDAYPPVENYTWFKEGGSSPVGSGPTYVPLQNGSYYCQAENQHGAQRSAAISVWKQGFPYAAVHTAVGVACGLMFLVSFFFIRSRNKRRTRTNDVFPMSTVYADIAQRSAPSDPPEHTSEHQEDLYANVLQWRAIDCTTAEEHPRKNTSCGAAVEEKLQQSEVQYVNVKFQSSAPTKRYDKATVDDPSAIYSRVKSHQRVDSNCLLNLS